jgi:hypothetical protein
MRHHPVGDRFVIVREIEFGRPEVWIDHASRMRDRDAGDLRTCG